MTDQPDVINYLNSLKIEYSVSDSQAEKSHEVFVCTSRELTKEEKVQLGRSAVHHYGLCTIHWSVKEPVPANPNVIEYETRRVDVINEGIGKAVHISLYNAMDSKDQARVNKLRKLMPIGSKLKIRIEVVEAEKYNCTCLNNFTGEHDEDCETRF